MNAPFRQRTLTSRTERVAEAQRLRSEGLIFREIAEAMGVAIQTVDSWLNDPDGSRCRARKDSYGPTCIDCGVKLNGHAGPNGKDIPKRCRQCQGRAATVWTEEAIIEAFHRFVAAEGYPPSATHWHPSLAKRRGHPEYVERFDAGNYPNTNTVIATFGSWSAGMAAAGLPPRRVGRPRKEAA